jgi:hypothetical protein
MKESDLIDPKATKTTLRQMEKYKSQPTDRHGMDNRTLNQGNELCCAAKDACKLYSTAQWNSVATIKEHPLVAAGCPHVAYGTNN